MKDPRDHVAARLNAENTERLGFRLATVTQARGMQNPPFFLPSLFFFSI